MGCRISGGVSARLLPWDSNGESLTAMGDFDLVIGADCLFFKDFHLSLVELLRVVIKPDGKVLLLQPRRGDSLRKFVEIAAQFFLITETENYSDDVFSMHREYLESAAELYDPDIHQPILLTLKLKR